MRDGGEIASMPGRLIRVEVRMRKKTRIESGRHRKGLLPPLLLGLPSGSLCRSIVLLLLLLLHCSFSLSPFTLLVFLPAIAQWVYYFILNIICRILF